MRGEVWTACWCCDVYLKSMLMNALEVEAGSRGKAIKIQGRSLENWISEASAAKLRATYVSYRSELFRPAIAHTIELYFDILARLLPSTDAEAANEKRQAVESRISGLLDGMA